MFMKHSYINLSLLIIILFAFSNFAESKSKTASKKQDFTSLIPKDYLREPNEIPTFWVSTVDEVVAFLKKTVKKGTLEVIGKTAGNRPIYAVKYGQGRQGKGTTTLSGSLSFGNVGAYRGEDNDKTVYMSMAGVHGGEFEGIVGLVNLISVLETGKDIRGKEWPKILEAASKLNRIIIIPIVNSDARIRIPLRMEAYRGTNNTVAEFFSTGGKADGTLIGWPQVKEFIPFNYTKYGFPGGYPNDNGYNIQHDDFFGKKQPETQALFDLTELEKPDLIMNLHTGGFQFMLHSNFGETKLIPVFDKVFKSVHTELTVRGLQQSTDTIVEANPLRSSKFDYNLDGALNLHCGALTILLEAPSHSFSGKYNDGKVWFHSPEMLLDGELVCQQKAMEFLVSKGGRSKWKSIISK